MLYSDTEIGTDIERACAHLRKGDLVGLPTETVYGLAANALNEQAVLNIFEAKQRPHFDPLICHVPSLAAMKRWVLEIPEPLLMLADTYMPGPLTLLLPKTPQIPDLVTSGLDRVAMRVPAHPFAQEVLSRLDFPVAAPSANPFGYISPTLPEHVKAQLNCTLPYILDGGKCRIGLESTIVGMEEGLVTVYRLGGMTIEDIERIVGHVQLSINQSSNPKAPGQLKSHYAPRTPLTLLPSMSDISAHKDLRLRQAVIGFDRFAPDFPEEDQVLLSPTGDLREAAQHLFQTLRLLDTGHYDAILAIRFPDVGLGRAINDRLMRAATL